MLVMKEFMKKSQLVDSKFMLRSVLCFSMFFTMLTESSAFALDKFGIGVGIGDISGISLYGKIDAKHFGQSLVSFSNETDSFAISADYGIAFPGVLKDLPIITPYYGFGAVLVKYPRWFYYRSVAHSGSTTAVGGRLPLGAQLDIPETPIQLALEIVPGILVIPGTYVFIDAMFAVRVVF
jgi:hypothetical protein